MFYLIVSYIVVVTLSLIIYYSFLYPRYISPLRSIPGPPWGHILFGQFPAIMKAEAGILQREWIKQHGPTVRAIGPFGLERVIFTKAEALHKILVSDWIAYPRPAFMRKILGFATGFGLLTVTGNEHKQMRKCMNPAFSVSNLMAQMEMYYDPIESLVEILKAQLKDEKQGSGKVLQMYDWMSKVTLDIICETAFGYRTDSLHNPDNELARAYEQLINLQSGPNVARFVLFVSIPGAMKLLQSEWAYRHQDWLEKIGIFGPVNLLLDSMYTIRKISARMLQEKIQSSSLATSDMGAKKDIMSLLVRARQADSEQGGGYAIQVLTFLGAGHETTASGLAWTLWLLANDKSSQDRLRREVKELYESNPRPDYRSLKELQWLDCVVMESLRVLPPVPMTFRRAEKTGYIDGVLIPKGTILYIPIRVVNTLQEIWGPDAEEFKPERWLNLPPTHNPTCSMLSFLSGPHACIGKTMAVMEMKAVLAVILANFEFEPAYENQIAQPTAAVTMKPKDGMPLRVKLAGT